MIVKCLCPTTNIDSAQTYHDTIYLRLLNASSRNTMILNLPTYFVMKFTFPRYICGLGLMPS